MLSAEILLAVVVPLGIWAMLLLFVLAILLASQDGIRRLKRLHQVPCFHCRYYTGSPYLKCPVRPVEAASEVALHCTDYAATDAGSMQPTLQLRLRKRLSLLYRLTRS
jgi:hypothetical protein